MTFGIFTLLVLLFGLFVLAAIVAGVVVLVVLLTRKKKGTDEVKKEDS